MAIPAPHKNHYKGSRSLLSQLFQSQTSNEQTSNSEKFQQKKKYLTYIETVGLRAAENADMTSVVLAQVVFCDFTPTEVAVEDVGPMLRAHMIQGISEIQTHWSHTHSHTHTAKTTTKAQTGLRRTLPTVI